MAATKRSPRRSAGAEIAVEDDPFSASPEEQAIFDVFYLNPSGTGKRFMGRLQGEDVQEAVVEQKWGGGRYLIQKKVRNAENKLVIDGVRTWAIEGEHRGVPPTDAEEEEEGRSGSGRRGGSSVVDMGIMDLFRQSRESQELQRTLMMDYLRQSQTMMAKLAEPSKPFPWEVVVPALVTLLTTVLQGKGNQLEMVKELAALAKLNRDDTPADKLIEMFQKMMVLRDEVRGDAEPEDPLLAFAKAIGPEVAHTLQHARARETAPAQPAPPAPRLAPGSAPEGGTTQTIPLWARALSPHVPRLVELAAKGRDAEGLWLRDPSIYADMILDQMTAEEQESFGDALTNPGFLDHIARQVPSIQGSRAWFEELVQHLRDRLAPDEEEPAKATTTDTAAEEDDAPAS